MSKKLADFSNKEQCAMPYSDLLELRKESYIEHMSVIPVPKEIIEWARKMEFKALNNGSYERHCESKQMAPGSAADKAAWCKTFGIWYQRLPLVTVFMILRWGEEPAKWPSKFTSADIHRASTWFSKPSGNEGLTAAERAGV